MIIWNDFCIISCHCMSHSFLNHFKSLCTYSASDYGKSKALEICLTLRQISSSCVGQIPCTLQNVESNNKNTIIINVKGKWVKERIYVCLQTMFGALVSIIHKQQCSVEYFSWWGHWSVQPVKLGIFWEKMRTNSLNTWCFNETPLKFSSLL